MTGESITALLRGGNKTANSAADHIRALDLTLAQLPEDFRGEDGNLVRTDSAGSSREFLNHLHAKGIQFSTSFALPVLNERFIHWINDKTLWERVVEQDLHGRRNAWVIDATKVIILIGYPESTRLYLRAELLHPGAGASLFDVDGHRVTAFLTNAPGNNVAFLDARHRAPGRRENRVKTLKAAGLGKLPFSAAASNQLWANLAVLAMNLASWMQLSVLPTGHDAVVWDLNRWRFRLFRTPERSCPAPGARGC